ncbi:MAG TPA: outer membrane beta-barrel protein [Pseudolabrys sp.]|nr:outer membrane beta-barrel protein [Pseudolabrys sp.]
MRWFGFAIVSALVGVMSVPGYADDAAKKLPNNPPSEIAAPVNWTGFYIGGDIGGLSRKGSGTSDFFQTSESAHTIQGQSSTSSSGAGGVYAGFNWQFAPSWVAGIEGDWQWTHSQFSACRQTDTASLACTENSRGFGAVGDDVRSFGTVRGRLGIAFDRMLVYGTGGVAFTEVRSSLGLDCVPNGCGSSANPTTAAVESSTRKTGWVAGVGIERMFGQNWVIRAEYQHADFGNLSNTLFLPTFNCFNNGVCGLSWSREMHFDIVRAGLSYKFGGF